MLYQIWNACSMVGMILLILLIPMAWIFPGRVRGFMQKHRRFSIFVEALSIIGYLRAVLPIHYML